MREARVLASAEGQKLKDEAMRQAAALESYDASLGQVATQSLRAALPQVFDASTVMKAIPAPLGPCIQVDHGDVSGTSRAVAWSQYTRKSNLNQALQEHWNDAHKMILRRNVPSITQSEQSLSPCLDAGLCLCSEGGLQLSRLRTQLHKLMKACFHTGAGRHLLRVGDVVAQFSTKSDGLATSSTSVAGREVWLHLSLMYFKPFRSTWHVMDRSCSQAEA
eukprot:6134961-Amphidinium_carterae.1